MSDRLNERKQKHATAAAAGAQVKELPSKRSVQIPTAPRSSGKRQSHGAEGSNTSTHSREAACSSEQNKKQKKNGSPPVAATLSLRRRKKKNKKKSKNSPHSLPSTQRSHHSHCAVSLLAVSRSLPSSARCPLARRSSVECQLLSALSSTSTVEVASSHSPKCNRQVFSDVAHPVA